MRTFMMILTAGMVACGGAEDRTDTILALEGDPVAGKTVFEANCATCHASSGLGVDDPTPGIGQNLTEAAGEVEEDAEFIGIIIDGEGEMTAFGDSLDDQQIADVLAYLHDGLIQ